MKALSSLSRLFVSLPPSRNKARVGRILTRLLVQGKMNSIAEIQMRDGSKMLLDARSRTESGAFWNGEHDRDDLDFFKVCLQMGNVMFDVGANVGLISIPLARFLRDNGGGTIIAFEPVKSNFDRLSKTIQVNRYEQIVLPFNIALGEQEGEIEMAMESHDRWQGGASTGNATMVFGLEDASPFSVSKARVQRLDTFVKEHNIEKVDFIKVDIEGAELMFLRGGIDFLSRCRPIIYGEFNFPAMPKLNHTFLDVYDLMRPLNYRFFAFEDRLKPTEVLQPRVGIGNIFLVPEEKADKLLSHIESVRCHK